MMTEKYRGEFGSSPCLLDDTIASPALMAQWEQSIPELNTRQPSEKRYIGDMCKIGGVVHVWGWGVWRPIEEAMMEQHLVEIGK